jgi:hypothetical protein
VTQLIYDLDLPALTNLLKEWNEPAYRAKQIWQGLYQHLYGSPEQFTNLSKGLREKMSQNLRFVPFSVKTYQDSADGFTRKTLFELQAMGTPSMSLANPVTQVDRFRAARFPANTPFDREDGPQALARCICTNAAREIAPVPMISSGKRCAELILGPLDSI